MIHPGAPLQQIALSEKPASSGFLYINHAELGTSAVATCQDKRAIRDPEAKSQDLRISIASFSLDDVHQDRRQVQEPDVAVLRLRLAHQNQGDLLLGLDHQVRAGLAV